VSTFVVVAVSVEGRSLQAVLLYLVGSWGQDGSLSSLSSLTAAVVDARASVEGIGCCG